MCTVLLRSWSHRLTAQKPNQSAAAGPVSPSEPSQSLPKELEPLNYPQQSSPTHIDAEAAGEGGYLSDHYPKSPATVSHVAKSGVGASENGTKRMDSGNVVPLLFIFISQCDGNITNIVSRTTLIAYCMYSESTCFPSLLNRSGCVPDKFCVAITDMGGTYMRAKPPMPQIGLRDDHSKMNCVEKLCGFCFRS